MSSNVFKDDILTRPSHFEGQVVKEKHLQTEQDYLDFLRLVNNYYIHKVSGVLTGLGLSIKNGTALTLQIAPGLGHYAETMAGAPSFTGMREVCVLAATEFNLSGKIANGGDYKVIATSAPRGTDTDPHLGQPNYMQQLVSFEVRPLLDSVVGLNLGTFTYDSAHSSISGLTPSKVIPRTVRSINEKEADDRGNLQLSADYIIQVINQGATTTINETHVSGVTQNEFDTLVNTVNQLKVTINELSKRIPRYREVRS